MKKVKNLSKQKKISYFGVNLFEYNLLNSGSKKFSKFGLKIVNLLRNKKTQLSETGSYVNRSLFAAKLFKQYYGGLSTKFFRQICKIARGTKKQACIVLFQLLELRLLSFLYRINFSKTFFHAKQLIFSQNILVNYKIVTSGVYQLHIGDFVSFLPKKKLKNCYFKILQDRFGVLFSGEVQPAKRFFSTVNHAFVDYEICAALVISCPKINSLMLPVKFVPKLALDY